MKVNPHEIAGGDPAGPSAATYRKLVVLYGIGGLSDVGRHAIMAGLEKNVEHITVITEYPDMLDDENWECGCIDGHTNPFNDEAYASKLTMVKIDSWKNEQPNLVEHFHGADAVISCLSHRQPGWKNKELVTKGLIARDGNKQVIKAMEEANVSRVVTISSFGLNRGDKTWPHWASKLMRLLFLTFNRKARKDLQAMEKLFNESSLDYLIVKPVGIGEDVVPAGKYFQQEPGKEAVGGNMAKMDVARFMVDEAIQPTTVKGSKVVGSAPGTPMSG
ncbi:SDR family oxidoreductase [Skeletonema marinoi]|uniref:SDR family oxidoreductase n=1 Tax=Skeletonema marinoi TaxID=267567 RepID=A0AAD8YEW0_9STRA|nr:SDR family oxidoreductase [Skeletonema marinoi]